MDSYFCISSSTPLRKIFRLILLFPLIAVIATCSSGGGDPKHGILQLSGIVYSATEGTDASVTVSVTRTNGSDDPVSVDYVTSDGTATQPGDYTTTNGTLNWSNGDAATKTIQIPITNDDYVEAAESFTINLSNVKTAKLGNNNTATITITDEDVYDTVQISSASYFVTEGTDNVATVTVTRTGTGAGSASIYIATSDGTAVDSSDYTANSETLTWNDGDTTPKTFDVVIINNGVFEFNKSFYVTLSTPVGVTLGSHETIPVTIYDDDTTTVTGTVLAPGGSLAMQKPALFEYLYAMLFGDEVDAAISDIVSPVVGVTVSVYEVDADGNLVSNTPYGFAITDAAGNFTVSAPVGLPTNPSGMIVRAVGASMTLDSRITSTTINVDPSTDATSHLVTQIVPDLTSITIQEIAEMQADVEELITDIDYSGVNATALSDLLYNKALSKVAMLNVVRSKISTGSICGNVQSASPASAAIDGVDIIVRDYTDGTTRARTITDASGNYCVNVPVAGTSNPDGGTFSGEYIIGAINRTSDTADAARSASEWLGSGTSYTPFEASMISVPNTTTVTRDFVLEPGTRIKGLVRSSVVPIVPVEGVQIIIRDFDTDRLLASARTEADGSYQVNVIPGYYRITAKNRTTAPYATEILDFANGTNNPNLPTAFNGTVLSENTVNFDLDSGSRLSGNISDGSPVVNASVRIDISGDTSTEGDGTDRNGDYEIWLSPGTYDVFAHGQRSMAVDLSSDAVVNFNATVSSIIGKLEDSGANPVRNAGVWLYTKPDATTTNLYAATSSDAYGNFEIFTSQAGDHLLQSRIKRDSTVAGNVYLNQTRLLSGTAINVASVGDDKDLTTMSLPDGGMLKGTVYLDSSFAKTTPARNFRVQVRSGGNTLDDRFIQVRTQGDGTYQVALPPGTYDRVKMRDATGASTGNGNCNNIVISAATTTVVNFYDGDNTCEINP